MEDKLKHIRDILIHITKLMDEDKTEEAEREIYDLLYYVETGKHENN